MVAAAVEASRQGPASLALMQPYFFPYLGYFQLICAVDRFVFYDDVQYRKNSWINRNRILLAGAPHYLTVPVHHAALAQPIREVAIAGQPPSWRRKLLATLHAAYAGAPGYAALAPRIADLLNAPADSIGELAKGSVRLVFDYLDLPFAVDWSSATYGNAQLSGAARVVDIVRRAGARTYVNAPGGRTLYNADAFAGHGLALRFLDPVLAPYPQGAAAFVPGLSIIDLLMHVPTEEARAMLAAGRVVP